MFYSNLQKLHFFCMYLLCFFFSILSIFYVINFECYFILFHFAQFSQTHLQYSWQHFMLKSCLVVVSYVPLPSVLFSLFSFISFLSSVCLVFISGFCFIISSLNPYVFCLTPVCFFVCFNRIPMFVILLSLRLLYCLKLSSVSLDNC